MQPDELDKQAAVEKTHWWFRMRRALLTNGLSSPRLENNSRILEIGAATGGNFQVCQQFGNYYALDLSSYALGVCQGKGIGNLVRANGRSLPFDGDQFDAVIAFDILEHIEEDNEAIGEIFRILKPGGRLLVNVPAFQWMFSAHDSAFDHVRRYQPNELESKVAEAGFAIDYRTYWSFFIFPAVALVRAASGQQKSQQETKTDFDRKLPKPAEWMLNALARLELALIRRRISLPIGISLLCFARKAAIGDKPRPA